MRISSFHICIVAVLIGVASSSHGDDRLPNKESAAASLASTIEEQAVEVVRANRAGVLVAVLVKPGDRVSKDQVLGHTELDTAKLNMDLAKASLESTGTLQQMFGQYQAFIVTREETEKAVRKRTMEKSRLEFAQNMEKWAMGQYQAQLDIKKVQKIQFEYHEKEYQARFIKSPVDGIVSEVKMGVGQQVAMGSHVFSITSDIHRAGNHAVRAAEGAKKVMAE